MKLQLSHFSLAFLWMLFIPVTGNGQKNLVVTQSENITAEAGGSVTITCSFTSESPFYSVRWTLGCNDNVPLQDHPCFQRRVNVSSSDAVQTPNNTQVPISERKTTITIYNLTENDSGTFCCHIKVANAKMVGTGPGTKLEVTPRSFPAPEGQNKDLKTSKEMYILYAVIGAEACVIIILIAVVIRYHSRGSSRSEDQGLPSDPSGLQYAEICRKSFPQQSRPRINVDTVTYSAVKTKKEEHLTSQEYGF